MNCCIQYCPSTVSAYTMHTHRATHPHRTAAPIVTSIPIIMDSPQLFLNRKSVGPYCFEPLILSFLSFDCYLYARVFFFCRLVDYLAFIAPTMLTKNWTSQKHTTKPLSLPKKSEIGSKMHWKRKRMREQFDKCVFIK